MPFSEIVLPAAELVPPIVLLLLPESISTPSWVLFEMVLPPTVFVAAEAVSWMPVVLNSTTLDPLTTLLDAPLMSTPTPLPRCWVAFKSVPMKLPETRFPWRHAAGDLDARSRVQGDHIRTAGTRPANRIRRCAIEQNADQVGGRGAIGFNPDEVAQDLVAGRTAPLRKIPAPA